MGVSHFSLPYILGGDAHRDGAALPWLIGLILVAGLLKPSRFSEATLNPLSSEAFLQERGAHRDGAALPYTDFDFLPPDSVGRYCDEKVLFRAFIHTKPSARSIYALAIL